MMRKKGRAVLLAVGLSLAMTTSTFAAATSGTEDQLLTSTNDSTDETVSQNDGEPSVEDLMNQDTDSETESEEADDSTGEATEEADTEETENNQETDAEEVTTDEQDQETVNTSTDAGYFYTDSKGYVHYVDANGNAVKGWCEVDGETYYFSPNAGYMQYGWKSIGGKVFYFGAKGSDDAGQLYTGWQRIGSYVFYFEPDGATGVRGERAVGWKEINGKTFYFAESGKAGIKGGRATGWKMINNYKFYFKPSGKAGDKGSLMTGFQKIGNYTYILKTKGAFGVKGRCYTVNKDSGGLKNYSGNLYYLNKHGQIKYGWKQSGNYWYYFDKANNGRAVTGWKYISVSTKKNHQYSSYKFYFNKSKNSNGPKYALLQDVSSIIGKQSSYQAVVDRTTCVVTIYAKDTTGKYCIPVKAMTCSVGLAATPTPKSGWSKPYKTISKSRWQTLMGPSYGQYATRVVAGIYFHSVAGSNTTSYNLSASNYNMLGQPASHGCIRLNVRDAKWIYDNCKLGMSVVINDNMYNPFDKPATIKIPANQTYDPTDPAVK